MYKHIIKISFAFSILLLMSCSSNEDDSTTQSTEESTTSLDQKPKKSIPYPSLFTDTNIPLIDGAYVVNKKELKNTKNKTGMRIWEKSEKSFDDVVAFYLENLEKSGWERKTDADKQNTPEQERDEVPVKYFVTKFHKYMTAEKKRYVLLINVTSGNDGVVTIIKILKEM
jgi:hypothetical protein